jgi:hypothetical protein
VALVALCAGCPDDGPQGPGGPQGGGGGGQQGQGGQQQQGQGGGGQDGEGPAGPGQGANGPEVKPVEPVPAAAIAEVDEPTLRKWGEAALTLPATAFVDLAPAKELLVGVLTESSGAASLFLEPAFDPHRGATGGRWTAHPAGETKLDLLRCEYRAAELSLVLTEGANFLLLEVRRASAPTPAALRDLLDRLVQTDAPVEGDEPRAWKVDLPTGVDLTQGTHRFTNEGAPPVSDLQGRDQRVDVLVVGGRVFFVFYKKVEQLIGFAKADAWFPAAAREKLKAAR